jgi:hypothetical protein
MLFHWWRPDQAILSPGKPVAFRRCSSGRGNSWRKSSAARLAWAPGPSLVLVPELMAVRPRSGRSGRLACYRRATAAVPCWRPWLAVGEVLAGYALGLR